MKPTITLFEACWHATCNTSHVIYLCLYQNKQRSAPHRVADEVDVELVLDRPRGGVVRLGRDHGHTHSHALHTATWPVEALRVRGAADHGGGTQQRHTNSRHVVSKEKGSTSLFCCKHGNTNTSCHKTKV